MKNPRRFPGDGPDSNVKLKVPPDSKPNVRTSFFGRREMNERFVNWEEAKTAKT
jgi:hypothetical protein